jgi:hypothetical protein
MDEAIEFVKKNLEKYNRTNEYDFNKGYDKFDTSTYDYKEKITLDSLLENDYRSYLDYVNPREPLMPLDFYRLAIENAKNLSKYEINGVFDSKAYENSKEKEISDKLSKEYKNRQIARNINKKINNYVFNEISNIMIDTYALEKIYTLIDQVYELSREKLKDSIECEFYLLSKQDENGHNIIKDIFFEMPQYNIQTRCEGLLKDKARKILDKKKIDYDILGWSHSHGNLGLFFSDFDDRVVNTGRHLLPLIPKIDYENETFTIENKVPISIVFNRTKNNNPYRATFEKPIVGYDKKNEKFDLNYEIIDIANTYQNKFSNKCISLNVVKDAENKKVDVNYIREMVNKYIIPYYKNPVQYAIDTGRSPIRDKVYISNKYKDIKRKYELNPNIIYVDPVKKVRFDPKKFIEDYEKNMLKEQEEKAKKTDDKSIDVDYKVIEKEQKLDDKKQDDIKKEKTEVKEKEDKKLEDRLIDEKKPEKEDKKKTDYVVIDDKTKKKSFLSKIFSYAKNIFKKETPVIKSKIDYQKIPDNKQKYQITPPDDYFGLLFKDKVKRDNKEEILQKEKKEDKDIIKEEENLEEKLLTQKKSKSTGNFSDLVNRLNDKISNLQNDNNRLNIDNNFLQDSYLKLLGEYQSLENKLNNTKTNYKSNYRTAIKDYHYKYSNQDSNLGIISKMLSGDYRGLIDNIKKGELAEKPQEKRLWKWSERFEAFSEMYNQDKNYFKNMDTNVKNELISIIKNNTYLSRKHKEIKNEILKIIET